MAKIRIKGYKRKSFVKDVMPGHGVRMARIEGTFVRGHTREDKGHPGKTPKSEKWFQPKRELGWSKDEPQKIRIRRAISSRPSNWSYDKRVLSSARALQALANVSTDRETTQKAKADAAVLRRRI